MRSIDSIVKLDLWQKEVIESNAKFIAIRAGRQVGKSFIVSLKAAIYAIQNPKKTVLIVASVDRQAMLLFEKVVETILLLDKSQIGVGENKPTLHHIKLRNGTHIHCLPTGRSGYGIRGYTVDLLICDEAAYIDNSVFTAITPMLATTKGSIILLSTPKGVKNFFYDVFQKESNYTTWAINSEDCPRMDKDYLKREKHRLTKLEYAQEYLGEFLEYLTNLFTDELLDNVLTIDIGSLKGESILGLDLARYGGDENAFAELIMESKEKMEIVSIETTDYVSTIETIEKIKAMNRRKDYVKIYLDDGGLGGPIFDNLLAQSSTGRKVIGLNNATRPIERFDGKKKRLFKEDLYYNLLRLMEQGCIKMIKHIDLRRSLASIQIETSETTGEVKIHGKYPHIAEAVIRCCWHAQTKGLNLFVS